MNSIHWQPQLSALALLDAYRMGDFEAVNSVLVNTPPLELHVGLVQLTSALLTQVGANNDATPAEVIDVYRRGMLAAAVHE